MKKLLIVFLLAVPVLAQDLPQPRSYSQADVLAEVGSLYLQVKQLNEFVLVLQARIKELQAENAKLKGVESHGNP